MSTLHGPTNTLCFSEYYHGSCLCGKVTFKARNFALQIGHCHCVDCRKFHGAAFSTFVDVAAEDFEWLSGEQLVTDFTAENQSIRQFCSQCGSSLTFRARTALGKRVEVALALFETSPEVNPDAHIFTDSKVPWIEIEDKLPCFRRNRT